MGRGDFLAVAEGDLVHFQAAFVSPKDIQKVVIGLAQNEMVVTGYGVGTSTPINAALGAVWGRR
jgi:hypothetical protein